jgi:CubicO group peptidase (beta-lactamase class C family)
MEDVLSDIIEAGIDAGWHDCAQCYVSLGGETLVDIAVGESAPGRALRDDDVMLWYSSGKPFTTVAVMQLWEQGRLGLDEHVGDFVDGWGAGKETATIRHLLTHTAGFPMLGVDGFDRESSFADAVARVAAHPAEWLPGTRAEYHPTSSWRVLGAIVERIDGRAIDRYIAEEIVAPLGLADTSLGVPVPRQAELGDRLVRVEWKGHTFPHVDPDGSLRMVAYRIDELHNQSWHVAKVEPGGGMRGPARSLGRFYESLLGYGPPILDPRSVEVFTAVHRYGLRDRLVGRDGPWGLGVQVDFTGGTTRRAFGHGGMASSRGLADRTCGLVLAFVANGLPTPLTVERRIFEITDAVYRALGDDVAPHRRPVEEPTRGFGISQ